MTILDDDALVALARRADARALFPELAPLAQARGGCCGRKGEERRALTAALRRLLGNLPEERKASLRALLGGPAKVCRLEDGRVLTSEI